MSKRHPMQKIYLDKDVPRFQRNEIVRFLLDAGPFNLTQLAMMTFHQEDVEQFHQLIGWSVSAYGGIPEIRRKIVNKADRRAYKLLKKEGKS